jgi:hypothetical protein
MKIIRVLKLSAFLEFSDSKITQLSMPSHSYYTSVAAGRKTFFRALKARYEGSKAIPVQEVQAPRFLDSTRWWQGCQP